MARSCYVLKKTDGSFVTAQEAYDAYMNGTVMLHYSANEYENVYGMVWYDDNGETADQNNVGYVRYYASSSGIINVGDESLNTQ